MESAWAGDKLPQHWGVLSKCILSMTAKLDVLLGRFEELCFINY